MQRLSSEVIIKSWLGPQTHLLPDSVAYLPWPPLSEAGTYIYSIHTYVCRKETFHSQQKAEHTNVIWPTQSFAFFRGHVYMYVYILYVCICMIHTYICMPYIHMYVEKKHSTRSDIHMYIYSHFSEGMFTYIHMYAYTYIYILHTYIYMYITIYICIYDWKSQKTPR